MHTEQDGGEMAVFHQPPRHIIVVSALISDAQDQLLLVRHHRRGWELPQGKVEEGECLLAALHREVREESGITVEAGPLAAVWSKLSPPSALILGFLARYQSGELATSAECPEVGWFTVDQAAEKIAHPVNRDRLAVLLGYSGEVRFHSYTTDPYRLHAAE